jgi:hypothetical protein
LRILFCVPGIWDSHHSRDSLPPPHARARLSSAREPASTDLGSGPRDACPSIRAFFVSPVSSTVCTTRYQYIYFCPRSVTVPAPARFICTFAIVTPSGIFNPSRDPWPGSTHVPVLPLSSTPSMLLATTCTASTFARAWSSHVKAQGIGAHHRYSCTFIVTLVLQSNLL